VRPPLSAALALIAVTAGCSPPGGGPFTRWDAEAVVCPDGATLDGIDVSYWQGEINWTQVANDGVDFAFVRLGDGLFFDPEFHDNWQSAKAEGIVVGAYQYFRPGTDPEDQANLLLQEMGTLQAGDLPPVLDVEDDDGYPANHVVQAIHDWMAVVEPAIGRKPIIYTSKYMWQSVAGDSYDFDDYPLWAANWFVNCPDIPTPWDDWIVWQTSDSGSVDGIGGNVDLDVFNGDYNDLMAFAVQGGQNPYCGDGVCNGNETPQSCPQDCGSPCDVIPPQGRTLDETDACYERFGNPAYWYEVADGHDGSLDYTHTTDSADVDNYGVWSLEFTDVGTFRVEAYTAAPHAQSEQATYRVRHHGTEDEVTIDQSAVDGWNLLGEFNFDPGADQWVRLNDNTGEPYNGGATQIVFDAIRLTPGGGGDDDDDVGPTDDDDDTTGDDDTGPCDDDDTGPADDDTADDDTADDDTGGDDDDGGRTRPDDDSMGCQCSASPSPAALPTLALLGLARVALRRRP